MDCKYCKDTNVTQEGRLCPHCETVIEIGPREVASFYDLLCPCCGNLECTCEPEPICGACNGRGSTWEGRDCPHCNGTGLADQFSPYIE